METNRRCYDRDYRNEPITVDFVNCDPEPKDWIAIFEARDCPCGATKESWGFRYMWLYTDGTKTGIRRVERGTVRFSDWYELLLDDGKDYKAYLLSNDGYQIKAESERFTKKSGDNYCSRSPTSPTRPTPRPSRKPTRRPTRRPTSNVVSTDDYYTNVDDDDDWGYGFDDDDNFDDDLGFDDDNLDDGVDDLY